MSENKLPDDPLKFVQRCVQQGRIYWTYHVTMRLTGRFIPRQAILESIDSYEIIEEYPLDKYFPSYLIYSEYQSEVFHIVFAVDGEEKNVRIITAYRPDPEEWEQDLKTRRNFL